MFPEKPTCHETAGVFSKFTDNPHWRPAREGETFRTCYYCGSIHPEDLLRELKAGATLDMADWKYGWPHKFYVNGIPNPAAGQTVCVGSKFGPNGEEPIMGKASKDLFAKWYNEHLQDAGFDDASWKELADILKAKTGVEFTREGDRLRYRTCR